MFCFGWIADILISTYQLGQQPYDCCPKCCTTAFTNRPGRSRPSDQTHRTAELRCCADPQFLAWASETVLPSATDLAQPPSGRLDGWHRPLQAPVYTC